TSSVSVHWRHSLSREGRAPISIARRKSTDSRAITQRAEPTNQPTMLLTAPGHKPTFLFSRGSSSNSVTRTRPCRLCKATLITNSESFEVGRLVGSYGFMNITSYSGFQSGTDIEYSSGDLGRLRVQDVGEGSVKISSFAGFTKGEFPRVHLEGLRFFLRFILDNELVVWKLI
ncbi:hypothetical protein F2P56_030993, partial [Juglans regia]